MRSALVHGALLVAALVAALVTWTADPEAEGAGDGTVAVWDMGSDQVVGLSYRAGDRRVEIERRGEGGQRYLWGTESFPTPPDMVTQPPAGAAPDSAAAQPATSVEQYPVAAETETLLGRLTKLRALRDLGSADDEQRASYGLGEPEPALTVRFASGQERTLVFGNQVPGGGSRYALELQGGHVYVVPLELVQPFESGVGTLRLMRYHGFQPDDVRSVMVRAGEREVTMERRVTGDVPPRTLWGEPGSESHDVAFGLLMQQLDDLWVMRYATDVPMMSLQTLLRADYKDWRGASIGFLELLRAQAPDGTLRYYMRTAKTIVVGEINEGQGDRILRDIQTLFGTSPRPAAQQ